MTSPSPEVREPLSRDLEKIAAAARETITLERTRAALERSLESAPLLLIIAPSLALLGMLLRAGAGLPIPPIPLWILIAGTLLPPLIVGTVRTLRAFVRPVDCWRAIAAVDRQLALEDRLITAVEFSRIPRRTMFMEAALADAAAFAPQALEAGLRREDGPLRWSRRSRALALLAGLLVIASGWFSSSAPAGDGVPSSRLTAEVTKLAARTATEEKRREEPIAEPPPPPTPRPSPLAAAEKGEPKSGSKEGELTDEIKETRGRSATGNPSDAATSSGASESRGSPTRQGLSSLSSDRKSVRKPSKPPRKERDVDPQQSRKDEEESGATAGRGATSGSNRSPAASEWSSKDQVVSEEEEDLENDEEVDDEFEDNDARGGVQPQLRDRKPPVNRDLTIGFGNQKNPDANGRGGPSEQKKSRGVASLVLGVPIPDHVKGRPNPGKTKITQERVEPKAEEVVPLVAEARRQREAPIGHLSRPDLRPWMRDLVKSYFLQIRAPVPANPATRE